MNDSERAQTESDLDFFANKHPTFSFDARAQLVVAAAINRQTETYIRLHSAAVREPDATMTELLAAKALLGRVRKEAENFLDNQLLDPQREFILQGILNEIRNQE